MTGRQEHGPIHPRSNETNPDSRDPVRRTVL